MHSHNELPDTLNELASSFGQERPAQVEHPTLEQVHTFVAANVTRLLENNPGLLMSILYRIDVPEPKVRHVLESEPPAVIVDRLTTLIIERQLEKVRIRRQYREQENDR